MNLFFTPSNRRATTKSARKELNLKITLSLELDDLDLQLVNVPVTTLDVHFANTIFSESTLISELGGG